MSDSFTRTTRQNYFQRLGNSFAGMLIGLVLLFAAPILLFWNDGRAVEAQRALAAAGRGAISLSSPEAVASNEGQLVHAIGDLTATTPAPVGTIAVAPPPTLVLERTVEMYQWQETSQSETRNKLGGTQETVTTYTYATAWSASAIDSSAFAEPSAARVNPPMAYESEVTVAQGARLGQLALPAAALRSLDATTPFIPETAPEGWTRTPEGLYRGAGAPEAPQVGDLRVSWTFVPVGARASVLARQSGNGLEAWSPKGSNYRLFKLELGERSADAMIASQLEAENFLTWVLRAVGTVLCISAFALLLGPLKALANVIPPVAWLIGSATGIVAVGLGVLLAFVTIAVAWIIFRPLIGIALIVVGVGAWLATRGGFGKKPVAA
jgi:hypothetical protein